MINIIKTLLLIIAVAIVTPGIAQKINHTFALGDSTFLLDGKPFQMISGELHYTRIPKEAWRHRMKMAKAMGLNTIGTYVFWNVHEPEKGVFDFSENNDIASFVRIAQEEGLWVVLRPSPYVCAEWEFGGYPYWLQKEEGLVVRSLDPKFLSAYKHYIHEVAKQLAPLQINHGGNILMVQVENEYGFYSNDKQYLEVNKSMFIEAGFDGILYTCDPAAKVADGYLPGLLPAINGIDNPAKIKSLVRTYHNGKGPFYIAEWYPAWFDWWGTKHHTVPAKNYAQRLDSVLSAGISINMYMFHGGTTRGFMNGANDNDTAPYEPQISSYDYDAPLDEAGNVTEKFITFRNVIAKHLPAGHQLPPLPAAKKSIKLPVIHFNESVSITDILPQAVESKSPLTFEDLNQDYGFVLYRTKIDRDKKGILKINELRDYGLIFINGKRSGILDRRLDQDSLLLTLPKGEVTLEILVENLGRVNFGPYLLKNKKGITHNVTFNGSELLNWKMYSLPFKKIEDIKTSEKNSITDIPVIKRATFKIDKPADTYLDMSDWGKGSVWINGHNLGRYWAIGPQQTLYVPAEWLKSGNNDVVVLELIKTQQTILKGIDKPILNFIPAVKAENTGTN
ncbi:MAG TPA: beta-galactosidase family protein [Cyclobacteriaceae bacterium]